MEDGKPKLPFVWHRLSRGTRWLLEAEILPPGCSMLPVRKSCRGNLWREECSGVRTV